MVEKVAFYIDFFSMVDVNRVEYINFFYLIQSNGKQDIVWH